MSTPHNGGPAFPQPTPSDGGGVSLRDWFAGRATEEDIRDIWKPMPFPVPLAYIHQEYTREEKKYVYADRMLAARERKGNA